MTEFVGRTGSNRVYSYPETPRGQGAGAFARNSAVAGDELPIPAAGVQIPWTTREVAGTTPVDVPFTPRSTGIVRVLGMFFVTNGGPGSAQDVTVTLQVDAIDIGNVSSTVETVGEGGGSVTVPFIIDGTGFTPGTTYNFHIKLAAISDGHLTLITGTLDVQELPAATG